VRKQPDVADGHESGRGLRARKLAGSRVAIVAIAAMAAIHCDVNSALEHSAEARRVSADLLVQFTKAVDAANRAVMADTDEASVEFAREAEQAKEAAQKDADALAPILQGLGYAEESRLLEQFGRAFVEYRALDRTILELAVLNTNLKAQRLSFGPAQEAADAFRDALEGVAPSSETMNAWRVKALVATAVARVREIQVLQAPHIAEADHAVMTRLEKRMATAEAGARSTLEALAPLVNASSKSRLASATAALDRFMSQNAQILELSQHNTNVRSLALSLNQKRKLTGACEDSLRALREALAKRGFTGTR
jgi:hypothetical protein